jgi:hypothetical protein
LIWAWRAESAEIPGNSWTPRSGGATTRPPSWSAEFESVGPGLACLQAHADRRRAARHRCPRDQHHGRAGDRRPAVTGAVGVDPADDRRRRGRPRATWADWSRCSPTTRPIRRTANASASSSGAPPTLEAGARAAGQPAPARPPGRGARSIFTKSPGLDLDGAEALALRAPRDRGRPPPSRARHRSGAGAAGDPRQLTTRHPRVWDVAATRDFRSRSTSTRLDRRRQGDCCGRVGASKAALS